MYNIILKKFEKFNNYLLCKLAEIIIFISSIHNDKQGWLQLWPVLQLGIRLIKHNL